LGRTRRVENNLACRAASANATAAAAFTVRCRVFISRRRCGRHRRQETTTKKTFLQRIVSFVTPSSLLLGLALSPALERQSLCPIIIFGARLFYRRPRIALAIAKTDVIFYSCWLWSPYVIGQTIIFSSCSFFLYSSSSSFFFFLA